jgi:DNA-binding MarR family transcriptional regulator
MTDADRNALRAWLDMLTASNAIKKSVDTTLRNEFGISISRFDVLSALDRTENEGMRAGDLSQRLMVTEGNTTQVTAPLIRDGLVKRTQGRDDGRVFYFRQTQKGKNLFHKMAEEHRHWIASAFSNLSQSELATLRRLLGKLNLPIEMKKKDAA